MSGEIDRLSDIISSIEGYSDSENIQDFPSQGIYEGQDLERVCDNFLGGPSFYPNRVIFFDSVVRLDFVVLARNSVVGFFTFALGHIEAVYSPSNERFEPVDLNKSVEYDVVRKLVINKSDLKNYRDKFVLNDKLYYEVEVVDVVYQRIGDLWNDYVLRSLLPTLEREYVCNKILSRLKEDDILVKDGLVGDLGYNMNVFGHVKTFNLSSEVLNDTSLRNNSISGIYRNGDYYSCYLDLSRNSSFLKGGVFGYSRLDVRCSTLDEEVLKRFRFVSKHCHKLVSVFSNSSRFPQNFPIIESLEMFLRRKCGDRDIIALAIRKHQ